MQPLLHGKEYLVNINLQNSSAVGYNGEMRIGPRFREFRDRLGLSQDEVGNKIGLPRQSVQQFEAVGSNPSFSKIETFLNAIGVTEAEFFEAKIPNVYADAVHADIHESLQAILESKDADAIKCITKAIGAFHAEALKGERTKAARSEKHCARQ